MNFALESTIWTEYIITATSKCIHWSLWEEFWTVMKNSAGFQICYYAWKEKKMPEPNCHKLISEDINLAYYLIIILGLLFLKVQRYVVACASERGNCYHLHWFLNVQQISFKILLLYQLPTLPLDNLYADCI